jgi:hypothetical protein
MLYPLLRLPAAHGYQAGAIRSNASPDGGGANGLRFRAAEQQQGGADN